MLNKFLFAFLLAVSVQAQAKEIAADNYKPIAFSATAWKVMARE